MARDEVAPTFTLSRSWVGEAGKAACERFVEHADDYDAAGLALRSLVKVYDGLADSIVSAQRNLRSALDYARTHELKVDDSGRVQLNKTVMVPPGSTEHLRPVHHAQGIIDDALSKATQADVEAARALRTIENLTGITDPKMVKDALHGNSPLSIALRLAGGSGGLHPINVSPSQLAAVDRAAAETGISKRLLLSILWQEQQWYQNFEPRLRGPLTAFGRFFDWSLQQTIKPDNSLGITHVKLETARKVIDGNPGAFILSDGTHVNDLSDAELTKYIEENPNENIRMSAYHLQQLRSQPYGADTDKQIFTLYAADTPDVREKNEEYGDESEDRGGAIRSRGENWDKLQPHLEDAMAWEALSDEERAQAVQQMEANTPAVHHLSVEPIYAAGGPTTGSAVMSPSLAPRRLAPGRRTLRRKAAEDG